MCDFVILWMFWKGLVWMNRGVCEKRSWSWVVRVGFVVFLGGAYWWLRELSYILLEKSNWAHLISKKYHDLFANLIF